jgi:prophage tail gpP-like protein
MRTLQEIVEAAKDGDMPDHHECYHALLVLSSVLAMDHSTIREFYASKKPKKQLADESHNRYRNALMTAPDEWLGDSIPGNAKYDMMRRAAKAVFNKVLEQRDEAKAASDHACS